ncbi:hypothetical protein OCU04_011211 [Sclerotinia nivalis]|uniref:Uncharacterized protein n=1 Tax=Sclerotinia nivalis TaxID=352851 RepID=A0A9X0DE82_9HELO|nr:hypothetical protein OCU04_011211 [Sclerotinia nivalis]
MTYLTAIHFPARTMIVIGYAKWWESFSTYNSGRAVPEKSISYLTVDDDNERRIGLCGYSLRIQHVYNEEQDVNWMNRLWKWAGREQSISIYTWQIIDLMADWTWRKYRTSGFPSAAQVSSDAKKIPPGLFIESGLLSQNLYEICHPIKSKLRILALVFKS